MSVVPINNADREILTTLKEVVALTERGELGSLSISYITSEGLPETMQLVMPGHEVEMIRQLKLAEDLIINPEMYEPPDDEELGTE